MAANTFGEHFRLTTFGESHGVAVGGVIDGCPSGLNIDFSLIEAQLARRRGDGCKGTTERNECDRIEWLSGVMDGITLGTPIAFLIRNNDARSEDYDPLKDWQRAGHADYTYQAKYGIRDHRGGGRASARETVARVVAGSIARQLLAAEGINITTEWSAERNVSENDTVGGTVRCTIFGVKPGVGEPVFNRLNARLAYAMFSIPSVMSFEMGIGKASAAMTGKEYADRWSSDAITHSSNQAITITNHCGGVQGGISNGMPIEFTVGFHPVVTQIPLTQCRNTAGQVRMIEIKGRHDRSHVSRASAIVEAMASITLADLLSGNGQLTT